MMTDGAEQLEIVKRPRVFRKRVNFRFQSFFKFNERFGLRSVKMEVLSNAIGHRLQHETQRNYALSIQHQIQIALLHTSFFRYSPNLQPWYKFLAKPFV
jgi:hypothetical protein